jgi:hypothetical protein
MLIYLRVFMEDCEIYIIIYTRFCGDSYRHGIINYSGQISQSMGYNRDTSIIPVEWNIIYSISHPSMGIQWGYNRIYNQQHEEDI